MKAPTEIPNRGHQVLIMRPVQKRIKEWYTPFSIHLVAI